MAYYRHMKRFVREKEDSLIFEVPNPSTYTTLNGNDVSKFYEELIQGPSECSTSPKKSTTHAAKSTDVSSSSCKMLTRSQSKDKKPTSKITTKTNNIWKAAETNDIASLKVLVTTNDVNVRDSFGWTSLMCAACSGAEDTVRFLLKIGADTGAVDRAGNNALHLASKNCHTNVIELLENNPKPDITNRSHPMVSESFFCEHCNGTFKTSQKKHEASTTHLLAVSGGKNSKTFYGIPDSNRGFQMLMRHGWNRETGLGPQGAGRKYPIKAFPKDDRSGIGASKDKKKPATKEQRNQTPKKMRNSRRCNKEKDFERNYRKEFL